MPDQILFVDDEPFLLESIKRELGFQYNILTAPSAAEALTKLRSTGAVACVVADYRMPQTDGVRFLMQVREEFPDTVRMMLTGNADLHTAVQAVNDGQVFRFLLKPCAQENMAVALREALRQHHLIIAEKELLEKTLLECVNVLTDVLNLVNPLAYGKSLRLRQWVSHVLHSLKLENAWEYELAAALSHLGWIVFPPPLLERLSRGISLSAEDTMLFAKHPFVTMNLIGRIPRFERVARIICGLERSIEDLCLDPAKGDEYAVDLGSHILKVCSDFDQHLQEGMLPTEALAHMQARHGEYLPRILDALSELKSGEISHSSQLIDEIDIKNLENGMILASPVKDAYGSILYKTGETITRPMIIELFRLSARPGLVVEPIRVVRLTD